jgi:predicted PurR-regulated permease PerM
MRPGVDALRRHHVPRVMGVIAHFLVIGGAIALLLWLAVPPAINQLTDAIGTVPTSSSGLRHAANHSTGIKHEFLVGLQHRLQQLPSGTQIVHPALTITTTALKVLVAIFFTLATAAYWIFERLRLLQDYLISPHVFGRAVGLSPLIVLVTVSAIGLLFGGFYVPLSVPLASVLATLAEVIVLDRDPRHQDVPTVLFSANDSES